MNIKQQMKWRSLGFSVGSGVGFFLVTSERIPMQIRLLATLVTGFVVAFPDLITFAIGRGGGSITGNASGFHNEQDDDS
jgi:hypothetical protein